MSKWLVRFCISLFAVFVGIYISMPVQAQSCAGVTFLNESDYDLNESAICEVTTPWVNKGHRVYVFVTDEPVPTNEDDWFAIRDRIEGKDYMNFYDPAKDEFQKVAVAVEISTDTSQPWGQEFAFGSVLFGTPLDSDAQVQLIEGQMKNTVAAGDVNGAIINAFNNAYMLAYPPATATPLPRPIQPAVAVPTQVIVAGPTTNVSVDFGPVLKFLLWTLLALVVLGGGYYVGLPFVENLTKRQKLIAHVNLLRARVNKLLNTCEALLQGETPEETPLYALWVANGGNRYTEQDSKIRQYLSWSNDAIDKAFLVLRGLPDTAPGSEKDLKQYVTTLETLYLTIVGKTEKILGMTENEQLELLDPFLVITREGTDALIVQQVDNILRQQEGAGSLRIDLQLVDPNEIDEEGIMGYIDQFKSLIHELSVAKTEAPGFLANAKNIRQKMETDLQIPSMMSVTDVFATPDQFIIQAQKSLDDGLWLDVKEFSQKAITVLEQIPSVLMKLNNLLSEHTNRQHKIDEFVAQGFRLTPTISTAIKEVGEHINTVIEAIRSGNYIQANEFIGEADFDSNNAINNLQVLVDLRQKNEEKLKQLANEVARVSDYQQATVSSDWKELQKYPRTNWESVASHFEEAIQILANLFDNPSDSNDLASSIASANSMEQQLFEKSESDLTNAFTSLHEAETKLQAISAKLADVKRIEKDLQAAVNAVTEDLAKARTRRDKDDPKIGTEVDREIEQVSDLLSRSIKASEQREFTLASDQLTEARQLAAKAYADADSQARTINELYQELANVKANAISAEANATKELKSLVASARTRKSELLVAQATERLQVAKRAEPAIKSEDHELARELRMVIEAYEAAHTASLSALIQIKSDLNGYQDIFQMTERSIDAANAAINMASQYVLNEDAERAGSHALTMAKNALPSNPTFGDTIESLQRRQQQADDAFNAAKRAHQEASIVIQRVEEAREAERRRLARIAAEALEAARREEQRRADAERRRDDDERRRRQRESSSSSSSSSSRSSSSSGSSSSRSSSSSSSPSRSSSSMGSGRRR